MINNNLSIHLHTKQNYELKQLYIKPFYSAQTKD